MCLASGGHDREGHGTGGRRGGAARAPPFHTPPPLAAGARAAPAGRRRSWRRRWYCPPQGAKRGREGRAWTNKEMAKMDQPNCNIPCGRRWSTLGASGPWAASTCQPLRLLNFHCQIANDSVSRGCTGWRRLLSAAGASLVSVDSEGGLRWEGNGVFSAGRLTPGVEKLRCGAREGGRAGREGGGGGGR